MGAAGRTRTATSGPLLSIGALSGATGIPAETLRTWETRYRFPMPERRPSGHRVYPLASVARLRLIAEAIARGHRAGQVVPASEEHLRELLEAAAPAEAPASLPVASSAPVSLDDLLGYVRALTAPPLTAALLGDSRRLGTLRFLETRVAPLIQRVGEAWESGRLDVRHEHFAADRLEHVLLSLRSAADQRARGPLAVLATLPGERHALGLQMAALVFATAGCRVIYLGADCPLPDIAGAAMEHKARVVAVSVSSASAGAGTIARVKRLRQLLPRRIALLLGGGGAPAPSAGIEVIRELGQLESWAQRLAAARR